MTQQADGPREPFKLRTRARISAHVIWDYAVRPLARTRAEVPWSADALSQDWLTDVLCAGHDGARVETVTVDGGSDGSSVRRRITVAYNDAGRRARLPEHLFAKTTPSLLTRLTAGLVAPREGAFYEKIKPSLSIETPKLYWTASDMASGRSLHLFEDLTVTKGARFCDYRTKISRAHAEDIVDLLATLHGTFYDSPRFAGDLKNVGSYESYVRTAARNAQQIYHERAMTLASRVIPADVMARRDEIWPMLMAGLRAHTDEPSTLIHSDVHLGNWYITGAERMGLCDWAIAGRGFWARDFAYAVSTTLAPEDRRLWERDLLRRYLTRLSATGGPAVGFDDAWNRYRQQLFGALLMWTPTLCPVPTRPEMQTEETSLEMIRRITTAISDVGALDSQPAA